MKPLLHSATQRTSYTVLQRFFYSGVLLVWSVGVLACSTPTATPPPIEHDVLEGEVDVSALSDVENDPAERTEVVDVADGSDDDLDGELDADSDVEQTGRVILWGLNADHCMPGHSAYRPPALQIFDQLTFDDPEMYCCAGGSLAGDGYYRGHRRACDEYPVDVDNWVEIRQCPHGRVEPQIAFEDGCQVYAHWTEDRTQICASRVDAPASTYWRREFAQQAAGVGPVYLTKPQVEDLCAPFPQHIESQWWPMNFEQLERDEPDLVCCRFYGYDEDGYLYRGGRRACDEPVNPLSNRSHLVVGDAIFRSFSCNFGYLNGCPTASVGSVFSGSGSQLMSPLCRRADRRVVEPWP